MQMERRQLHTWSEIARQLGVGVRAAQKYERVYRLPVKHMPGARGRVWAYADELDAWKDEWGIFHHFKGFRKSSSTVGTLGDTRSEESDGPTGKPVSNTDRYWTSSGHSTHALVAALIYGLLWGETVFLEIAYRFNEFAI